MSAVMQTIELSQEILTPKQEAFARYYVECRNATTAYRMAYNVDRAKGVEWMYVEASRTLRLPPVAAYIATLQEAAAAHTIVKARELVQDLADQASADASELVQMQTNNCRHCYGERNLYQWVDELELADAVAKVDEEIDRGVKGVKMPDYRGGFGFAVRRPPNPDCVKCEGRGSVVIRFTDTDKLSPRALKLYKGAKVTKGGIEMEMHDGQHARLELLKVLGVYGKDGNTLNPAAASKPLAADTSAEEASKAYLTMVSS